LDIILLDFKKLPALADMVSGVVKLTDFFDLYVLRQREQNYP
jgi:hypothetical protein